MCFVFVHSGAVDRGIQNVVDGNISVCPKSIEGNYDETVIHAHLLRTQKLLVTSLFYLLFILVAPKQVNRTRRETAPPSTVDLMTTHSAPLGVPFYLSCPIDSYHAVYTWEHGGQSNPCLQMQSNCLHLIPAMTQENYGGYECVSKEKDYTKVVKTYQLTEQMIPDRNDNHGRSDTPFDDASAAVPQMAWITLGLAVTVMGIFR